mmetsp:Transcript_49556/g.116837  ORF Transcript_49556/g.116837 Transcript_49556/m.116837 type:complete len:237 (-) Transcript_49556:338-1048(-)
MIPSSALRCARCPSHSTSCEASLLHARQTCAHLKRSEGGRTTKTTSCITSDQSALRARLLLAEGSRRRGTGEGARTSDSNSSNSKRACKSRAMLSSRRASLLYFSIQSVGSLRSDRSVLMSTSVIRKLSLPTSTSMSCLQFRRLLLPASCHTYFGAPDTPSPFTDVSPSSDLCKLSTLEVRGRRCGLARTGKAVMMRKSHGTPALAIRGDPCTSFATVSNDWIVCNPFPIPPRRYR